MLRSAATPRTWRAQSRLISPAGHRYFATSDKKDDRPGAPDLEEKKTKKGIRAMLKEYGLPFLVWESAVWLGSGVVVYGFVEFGGGYDSALPLLKSIGVERFIDPEAIDPRYGNLAIAIAINEALEVFRFPFVVATTPLIVKWWRAKRSKA